MDGDTDLAEQDRQILHLLATGAQDHTIARKMGISVRTMRRRLADIMTRLQARTRFQAGYQAARHGWLKDSID